MTDYPDWQTPQAHAAAISATGVPLLSVPNTLINPPGAIVLAGGGSTSRTAIFTQVGYAIQLGVNFPAAATNPFVEVAFTWLDVSTGQVYDEAHYFVAGSSSAGRFTTLGNGPVRSGKLTVTITNLDPAQSATVALSVAQDSSIRTADRWYWRNTANNGLAVPGFTLAQLPDDEDVLGILNGVSVPANGSTTVLAGMAPGRTVQLVGSEGPAAASSVQFQVTALPAATYTAAGVLLFQVLTSSLFSFSFLAPRAPLGIVISNFSAAPTSVSAMVTAAE